MPADDGCYISDAVLRCEHASAIVTRVDVTDQARCSSTRGQWYKCISIYIHFAFVDPVTKSNVTATDWV